MSASPPFSALRILEAASRHKSYTGAARELNVTHSAVSQSIKRLETSLGASLFARRGGAMEPSEAALKLAQTYAQAALALERTLLEVQTGSEASGLSLLVPAGIGKGWLAGRLDRLQDALPDLEVALTSNPAAPFDAQLLLAAPAPLDAAAIGEATLFAAHAPDEPAKTLDDALAAPLLVEAGSNWESWARRAGLDPSRTQHRAFDDPAALLDAAAKGAGVAVTHMFVAEAHLEDGRLRPLPSPAFASESASLVLRASTAPGKADAVSRLTMWLKLEAARSAARLRERFKSLA
ncbi:MULTISPECIES: LysR family transcriptional regulator [Phenylobacterium]|uniref:DNA-binding transcriptional LysR family regulator n=1 Tax=Phenylobacterium koreense TaxID=266125 RepID=A0ABV2EGZ9_9CAUL